MVVNFSAREISRDARKLAQTPTLIIIKKMLTKFVFYNFNGPYVLDSL